MPYTSIEDLPPAFRGLPQGAQSIAMTSINAVLDGKAESQELVTQAIRAAWGNIKERYKRTADGWAPKATSLAIAEEGLPVIHDVLAAELAIRGLRHDTSWPTRKGIDLELKEAAGRSSEQEGEGVVKSQWHRVLKADEELREASGIVYMADDAAVDEWVAKGSPDDAKPEVVDADGDWIRESNLAASYERFMQYMDALAASGDTRAFGIGHQVLAPGIWMKQAALLYKGTRWPDADSPALTATLNWVKQLKYDQAAWERFKKDGLRGLSLEGFVLR